jgi:chorismate dehydratase
VQKVDLGAAWTLTTGLPFVYALWVGWPDVVSPEDAASLQRARDAGVANVDAIAAMHCPGDVDRQAVVRRYLRDNIRCYLGCEEIEGLTTFYRYAAELGLVSFDGEMRFYHAEHDGAR